VQDKSHAMILLPFLEKNAISGKKDHQYFCFIVNWLLFVQIGCKMFQTFNRFHCLRRKK
jgi:hypothetical protein